MDYEDDVIAQQTAAAAAAAALVIYRGGGGSTPGHQLIPIEQQMQLLSSPPPPPPPPQPSSKFEWNKHLRHLSDEYIDAAFTRMEFIGRSDIGSTVSPNNFKISGFVGLEALYDKFSQRVIQRIKPTDVFASAFDDSRAYHFVLVGRPGFGKRTAIKKACALTNRDVVVITKEKYQPEDIALVSEFAMVKRPFVIYIDDFDALCQTETFLKEFKTLCASPFVTEEVFLNVWIIISVINDQEPQISTLLRKVCPDVNRVKIPEIPPDTLDKVLWECLHKSKIKIDPDMIDTEWTKFYSAIQGASPKDVKEFGLSITTLAMDKMPYDAIMRRSVVTRTAESHSRQLIMNGGQVSQQQSPPPQPQHQEQVEQRVPSQGDISLASAGLILQQSTDKTRFFQSTAATYQLEEDLSVNGIISWEEVEKLYVMQPASQGSDGICKAIIPRIS
jgi:hypothetical protein